MRKPRGAGEEGWACRSKSQPFGGNRVNQTQMGFMILRYRFPHTYQVIMERILPAMLFLLSKQRAVLVVNSTMMRTEAENERWPLVAVAICDHYVSEGRAKEFLDRVAANAGDETLLKYWLRAEVELLRTT